MTAATISTIFGVLAQVRGPWDGHMWGGAGWGWMWVGGLLTLLLLIGLAAAVIWAIVRGSKPQPPPDSTGRAKEILNERYARGDISTEEYRERLDSLR
jgi:putative membrane protein